MKKTSVLGLFLVVATGLMTGILTGCGSETGLVPPAQAASDPTNTTAPAQSGKEIKSFNLRSAEISPTGTNVIHQLNSWAAFDALNRYGGANLSGNTFVVEQITSNFQVDKPGDGYPIVNGILGRGSLTVRMEGTFVPSNGTVTKGMKELDGVLLTAGGEQTIDTFNLVYPIPECPECPMPAVERNFSYRWDSAAQYSSGELGNPDWSFANCNVYVEGGTIVGSYVHAGEILNVTDSVPWAPREFFIEITFKAIITGKMNAPIPTDGSGGGGKG